MSILAWIIAAVISFIIVSLLILAYIEFTRQRIAYRIVSILRNEGALSRETLYEIIIERSPLRHRYIFKRSHPSLFRQLKRTGLIDGDDARTHITWRGLKAAESYNAFLDRYLYR